MLMKFYDLMARMELAETDDQRQRVYDAFQKIGSNIRGLASVIPTIRQDLDEFNSTYREEEFAPTEDMSKLSPITSQERRATTIEDPEVRRANEILNVGVRLANIARSPWNYFAAQVRHMMGESSPVSRAS
jgi:hypothetical protein